MPHSLFLTNVGDWGEVLQGHHPSSLQFTMLLPNWIYLIFQQALEEERQVFSLALFLKIRLWELKEAGICPESTKALGWGENLVLQILDSVFSGFRVLQPLQMDSVRVAFISFICTLENQLLLRASDRVGRKTTEQV